VDGIRVDERHLEAEQTCAWTIVDQVCAGTRELGQRSVEIANLVGHMVHSGPSLREEAADGRVLSERLEQLDAAIADADGSGPHSLVVHRCAVLDLRAEQLLVGRERRIEILDRNA
jgi:hypothetical protein